MRNKWLLCIIGVLVLLLCMRACVTFFNHPYDDQMMGAGSPAVKAERFEYGGHRYILFGFGNGSNQVMHDPDCGLCSGDSTVTAMPDSDIVGATAEAAAETIGAGAEGQTLKGPGLL